MAHYLVCSSYTGSVVVEGSDLRTVLEQAAELGYLEGYITDQDGGYGDLMTYLEKYELV